MKFSEDQVAQLLSAFWVQANLPDNQPSNIEAIAHSYCLTLISLRLKVRILLYFLLLACFLFVDFIQFCFFPLSFYYLFFLCQITFASLISGCAAMASHFEIV